MVLRDARLQDVPGLSGFQMEVFMQKNIDALLRLPEVSRLTGLSRSALYLRISRGQFPRPVKLGPRASRWRLSDIQRWMDTLGEGCQ